MPRGKENPSQQGTTCDDRTATKEEKLKQDPKVSVVLWFKTEMCLTPIRSVLEVLPSHIEMGP